MKIALVFQAGNFVGREYYRVLCAAGIVPDWCLSIGAMSDSSIEYEKRRTGGLWNPPPIENDVFHHDKWEEMVNVLGHADVAIQAGCGMIGRISLALPRLGWIGVHPGRIPDYRGANCPEWAFLNGEWTTQLSAYWLTEDLDLGPIITHGAYSYHELRGMAGGPLPGLCRDAGARAEFDFRATAGSASAAARDHLSAHDRGTN